MPFPKGFPHSDKYQPGHSTTNDHGINLEVFSKSYVFDPRPNLPFRIAAKRYWAEHPGSAKQPLKPDDSGADGDALTLIFAHGTGFHKEHWEPVIRRLFEQQRGSAGHAFKIEDMWALDAPNQGDSGVLNEEVLSFGYHMFSWEEYARCIHAFLAGLGSGIDVDFSMRKLVAMGHSAGAVATVLSTTFSPQIKYLSMHIIEPVILGNYELREFFVNLIRGAEKRRDIWKSTQDAYETLKKRPTWRVWDDRTLRIFVEHGLRSLPTAEYPDRTDGMTLKCTRKQEAAVYSDHRAGIVAYRLLPHILKDIPTHITYGEMADLLWPEWRDDLLKNGSGGISNFAGVTFIPKAGHLVVQTHPDGVADVLWSSLLHTHSRGRLWSTTASRL